MSFSETIQKLQDTVQEIVNLAPKTVGFTTYRSPNGVEYTIYVADDGKNSHKCFYINQYNNDGLGVAFHTIPRVTITPQFIEVILDKQAQLDEILQSLQPSTKTKQAEIAFLKARLEELGE